MRNLIASLLLLAALAGAAAADTFTFTPNPADLYDLDHHMVYTWRVSNVNLGGQTITGATLSIKNIRNWDSNPNMLFVHLLDTARRSGVRSFYDDNPGNVPVTDITDDFVNTRWHNGTDARGVSSTWLVPPGTADILLFATSFGTTPVDFVYSFTAAQIAALSAFIANGRNFALGFDPDCHYWNDGISLTLTTSPSAPVPEPGTLGLIGFALAALWAMVRRRAGQRGQTPITRFSSEARRGQISKASPTMP